MKNRKIPLILLLATFLLLLFTGLNVFTSYVKMKKTVEESIANQSLGAATSIASSFDMETYNQFLKDPEKNEYYWTTKAYLDDASEKLGALYVYTMTTDGTNELKAMVVGAHKEINESCRIGEPCTVPEEQVKRAYEGMPFVTEIIEDPVYGTYLTVGVPLKDELGKVIGYLGVDISVDTLDDIKGKVLENNIFIFVYNGVFILVVIGCFFFLQKWYQKEMAKEVGVTEDTYQAEIKALITSVSSFRHDFTNHIQVLHGLLHLGESDQARQYLSSLSKEVQAIQSLKLDIEHPGLSILLQTKKLAAQNHNIDMDVTIYNYSFNKMKTTDLIKILSNLIDNAIEATIELPENQRKISIVCKSDDTQYIFSITNTGIPISKKGQIFKQGYSTKKVEPGRIRGQGLFIVKGIVDKYNGRISIQATGDLETTAIVAIPIK